jgi:predicted P-loop ATPase
LDYCKVASSDANPSKYAMAVGEKFLISAIARVMEPGCKVDHVLVLGGAQGLFKSTAASILAGEWFTDQLSDFGSKDCSMQLRGSWFIELPEIDILIRNDTKGHMKGFLTQKAERFRLPYGQRLVYMPRQCVFIGTANSSEFLRDETGGRRYWPVWCGGPIDIAGLRQDRDQLWAEALVRYRKGITWWLEDPEVIKEAVEQQRDCYREDVWQERVVAYVDGRESVSIHEILCGLSVETARQDQKAANRVAGCLRVAGWKKFRKREGTKSPYRYHKVGSK